MTHASPIPRLRSGGAVVCNRPVSSGLLQLDVRLDRPAGFLPGQFAMLNLDGAGMLVFSRPFSIFRARGDEVSFLYRVVGRGTAALAALEPGARVTFLGPLGHPFPEPEPDVPVVVVGGGVGLPPVHAWLERYGREGDLAFFGARDGGDVPWDLLNEDWAVSVDDTAGLPAGRSAWRGLVTDLVDERTAQLAGPRMLLACGPTPLLRAAADLAARRGWTCRLSLEEHMGCGYGVCKGCVVPVHDAGAEGGWRNATCCDEGPVFRAEDIAWERTGAAGLDRAD